MTMSVGRPKREMISREILKKIHETADRIGRLNIMEICGTHTNAIAKHGIPSLLPEGINLISGPGCPVCVTSPEDIDTAIHLADRADVIFCTFGDMLKVPGTALNSLERLKAMGRDIRVITTPLDCLKIATGHPDKTILFLAVGFETTSPAVAYTIRTAREKGIANFRVFSAHKLIPPAMKVLLDDDDINLDAFLLPGHVCTILGKSDFEFLTDYGKVGVITGFEAEDILAGIFMILRQINENRRSIEIEYRRVVREEGNARARKILYEVFDVTDAAWRGLGEVRASGLKLREEFHGFDAADAFDLPSIDARKNEGCMCGDILKGKKRPSDCRLFGQACTPFSPIGPCMVSHEGTCGAYYRHGRHLSGSVHTQKRDGK